MRGAPPPCPARGRSRPRSAPAAQPTRRASSCGTPRPAGRGLPASWRGRRGPAVRRRPGPSAAAARHRTAVRPSPRSRTCHRWFRRPRSTASRRPHGAAAARPAAGREMAEHVRHERSGAVHHRGVDHLALARSGRPRSSRRRCRRRAYIPPPPKSPTRLSGSDRCAACFADRVQRTSEGDVVDVVAGTLRQRPVLAPARHAAVDQARVQREAGLAGRVPDAP